MNKFKFEGESYINNPATLIGFMNKCLIFETENKDLYCMELFSDEDPEMFSFGDVFDTQILTPLSERSAELIRAIMKAGW